MEEIKIRKKDLINIIQNVESFINPKIQLEQYAIDAICAVDIIFFAGFEFDDIEDKMILDLGSGTGKLSIASAFLKAHTILSIDIDIDALNILKRNISSLNLENIIFPLGCNLENLELRKNILPKDLKLTTIMNPPFGVQKEHADKMFLKKAFSISHVIYSIHVASKKVQKFVSNYANQHDWKVDYILPYNMVLDKIFPFHTKLKKKINVDVYRIIKRK
ncbi:MAG: methyltransferase [Candidatus Lokiarchaeota archaeon]|nr:methyltransferase [Candidatus Lokiarchaeota archaeon]